MNNKVMIDDGGPAFPDPFRCSPTNHADERGWPVQASLGMSLRDYFAAAALPWCLQEFGGNADDMKQPTEAAYQIADMMLAERARRG